MSPQKYNNWTVISFHWRWATIDSVKPDAEVLLCYHCGNKTSMNIIAAHDDEESEEFGRGIRVSFWTRWQLFQCPVCERVTLKQLTWDDADIDPVDGFYVEEKILYPSLVEKNTGVPERVHKAFEAALKVRNLDHDVCIMALRRTLERLCKDQGSTGKTLYMRLKDLTKRNVLPPILDEMAVVLKDLGNEAAHADDTEFDADMVSSLIEFTQTIIDYIYVLPEKLRRVQEQMQKTSTDAELASDDGHDDSIDEQS